MKKKNERGTLKTRDNEGFDHDRAVTRRAGAGSDLRRWVSDRGGKIEKSRVQVILIGGHTIGLDVIPRRANPVGTRL